MAALCKIMIASTKDNSRLCHTLSNPDSYVSGNPIINLVFFSFKKCKFDVHEIKLYSSKRPTYNDRCAI